MDRREALTELGLLLGTAVISRDLAGPYVSQEQQKGDVKSKSERKSIVLSDNWKFQVDIKDIGEREQWFTKQFSHSDWGKVIVPQAWDYYETALWEYEGIGWYMTKLDTVDFDMSRRTLILFNRVMFYSKVWLNGEFIGENIGGYLPFDFNISDKLKQGIENTLVVRVDNKPRIEWLPAARQIEWIQYGGILDTVELLSTDHVFVEDMIIKTTHKKEVATINCVVNIFSESNGAPALDLDISILRDKIISSKKVKVNLKSNQRTSISVDLVITNPQLWSPETPVLYTATAALTKDDKVIDDVSDRFGIREVSVRGTSILLNGEPIHIKGVNRYDEYGRYGPVVPEKVLREELALMKSVGINFIRMHYPQSSRLLSLYDEYGFMMMEEIPLNWWGVKWYGDTIQSLDILHFAKPALTKMIARDQNHPSIIFWSMANESETNNDIGIKVMRDLLVQAKSLDPTRLVTFVVAGSPDGHLAYDNADIVCINKYNGVFSEKSCDHISDIDKLGYEPFVKELAEHRKKLSKPIVITEFGTQGIKNIHGDVSYSEEFQSAYIERIWEGIKSVPGVAGGVLWCWADYFHRKYFITYAAYGPYGVVTVDRKAKKSLEALARMFKA
ncbi:glycoside hydrolase family 2 protein [Segetibacter koreensis]|uniref:glycoside hydrolase family 2 protein n=1 Tax=Segetibacter koreensis TaxID=398037 RepID=UPI00035CBA45|nr:glycoside hydrolase family 2 [Segetibacter koreensis]